MKKNKLWQDYVSFLYINYGIKDKKREIYHCCKNVLKRYVNNMLTYITLLNTLKVMIIVNVIYENV